MGKSKSVDIPVKMEKYYGKGTMLHPSIEDVEELIRKITRGQIATIETLCKKLSDNYSTDVTCPMRTGNAIKKIARNYSIGNIDENVPFWRVVKTNKTLIKTEAYEFWATKIENEGFDLSFTKSGAIKVHFDANALFRF